MSLLSHFSVFEVLSLVRMVRSNTVWGTMMVGKVFKLYIHGWRFWQKHYVQERQIHDQKKYLFTERKHCPFHEVVQCSHPTRRLLVGHPGVVPQLLVSAGGRSVIHQQVWSGET